MASAHTVYNEMNYEIILASQKNNNKQCVEALLSKENRVLDVVPGDVVSVQNAKGKILGTFRIQQGAYYETILDKNFMNSQQNCHDLGGKRCNKNICKRGKGWTNVMCSKTCDTCHLQNTDVRCNATALGMIDYNVMKPDFQIQNTNRIFEQFQQLSPKIIHNNPEINLFDDFLNDNEVEQLLQYTKISGLKRSTGQGNVDANGVQEQLLTDTRTSENAWCRNKCESLSSMKRIKEDIRKMLNISTKHFLSSLYELHPSEAAICAKFECPILEIVVSNEPRVGKYLEIPLNSSKTGTGNTT